MFYLSNFCQVLSLLACNWSLDGDFKEIICNRESRIDNVLKKSRILLGTKTKSGIRDTANSDVYLCFDSVKKQYFHENKDLVIQSNPFAQSTNVLVP